MAVTAKQEKDKEGGEIMNQINENMIERLLFILCNVHIQILLSQIISHL